MPLVRQPIIPLAAGVVRAGVRWHISLHIQFWLSVLMVSGLPPDLSCLYVTIPGPLRHSSVVGRDSIFRPQNHQQPKFWAVRTPYDSRLQRSRWFKLLETHLRTLMVY